MIHEQTFTWTPKAKSRPRVTKYGTYTDAATMAAEKNIADQYAGPKFEGPVAVEFDLWNDHVDMRIVDVEDYTQRKLRGDTDNYLKLLSDSLNRIAYVDDVQIVTVTGSKK